MRPPVKLKIKFRSANLAQFIERYAVDVSKGGIFIRTKDPLEVGTKLKFEFQLQDGSPLIVGEGTVVWIREHDPNRKGVAPGMGVRFDKLQPESQKILAEILTRKAGAVLSSPEGEAEVPAEVEATPAEAPATAAAAVLAPAAPAAPAPEPEAPAAPVKLAEPPAPAQPADAVPVAGGLHDLETSKLEAPAPEKPAPAPEKPAPAPEKPAPAPEKPAPAPEKPAPAPEKPAPKPTPAATPAPVAASAPLGEPQQKSKAGLIVIAILAVVAIGLVGTLLYLRTSGEKKPKGDAPNAQRTEPDAAAELPMDPPAPVDAAAPPPAVQQDAAAPPACVGTLVDVTSEPSGAKIFLDDKDTGSVTPGKVCVVDGGTKKSYLRLELKNHKPGEYYFTKDQKVDTLKLEPISYRVVIQTEPRGAEVHVDGNRIGYTTMPYTLPWDKDVVVLKFLRRGYQAQELTLDRSKITWQAKGKYYFQGTIPVVNLKATGPAPDDVRETPPPDMRETPPPDMRETPPDMRETPPPDMRETPPPDMRETPPPDMRETPPDMRETPPPDMRVEPMRPADDGMDPGWMKPQ